MASRDKAMPSVAVIGCGRWGKNLVRNFASLGALAAVCDIDGDLAAQAASDFGVPAMDTATLFSDTGISAVAIAAPPVQHHPLAREALNAGKHVFVEKPLALDAEEAHQGTVMEKLGQRRGNLRDMVPDGKGRVRLDYLIPSRGLIGFRSEFLTATSGSGLMYHAFDHYGPKAPADLGRRQNGVLVSMAGGKSLAYALFNLQDRGRLFISPGAEVYEGMIVGIHARNNDLVVNPLKAKQLTNIRAAGSDENIILSTPVPLTLESALEFIDGDELVEVTPKSLRLRKKLLKEHQRKRAARAA